MTDTNEQVQTNTYEKLTQVVDIIKTIDNDAVARILLESISLGMRTLEQIAHNEENPEQAQPVDISGQLELVCGALGFNLEDLVTFIVKKNYQDEPAMGDKDVDQSTMDFITGDLDDYEKFIAQTKAKESIDFLKQQI